MGTKVGTQKVQDDLLRQNKLLERRIKALEMALKSERSVKGGEKMLIVVGQRMQGRKAQRRNQMRHHQHPHPPPHSPMVTSPFHAGV
jgi:hypothetical protein